MESLTWLGDAGRFSWRYHEYRRNRSSGDVAHGLGYSLYGGTIVVKGNAGGRIGQLNKGGTIIIDGNADDVIGLYSLAGDIIITGDSGMKTGEWIINGNIYVGGTIKGLGNNAKVVALNQEDHDKLNKYFEKYQINLASKDIKKVVPKVLRPFYKEKKQKQGVA